MQTEQQIRTKIEDFEGELGEIESEFEEEVEDESLEEYSDAWEELRAEYDARKEVLEKQIEVLEWVLK